MVICNNFTCAEGNLEMRLEMHQTVSQVKVPFTFCNFQNENEKGNFT